jgi:selenocysteine lyase/cysteine desulfurase
MFAAGSSGIVNLPTGTVRISPDYFNIEEEIQTIIETIAKIPAPEYSSGPYALHFENC